LIFLNLSYGDFTNCDTTAQAAHFARETVFEAFQVQFGAKI
jgi:hypothetical protein